MITTSGILLDKLKDYASPANKLSRLVKSGQYIRIKKGLYVTDPTISPYLLAGSIYGPSYLSFEYALSRYGLIPEAVYLYTCACFDKKKKKEYVTPLGTFTYRDIPRKAYPLGIRLEREGDYGYQIASPEKAICDLLYVKPPLANQKDLYNFLFENMRIDIDEFMGLSFDDIDILASRYGSTNVKNLSKLARRL